MNEEQLGTLEGAYWCSLVTAAPIPELPERVAVALLFGNGRPVRLALRRHLPRLAGVAPVNVARVYEEILSGVADRVAHGALSLDEVRLMLAPHLMVNAPRRLEVPLSDVLITTLVRRFLAPPEQPAVLSPQYAVMHASMRALDAELGRVKRDGITVQRKVTPERLYGPRVRNLRLDVPTVVRALRADTGRDVLVDGVKLLENFDEKSLRSEAMRIAEAFHAYRTRIIPEVVRPFGRDLRMIAVLHASEQDASPMLREVIAEMWSREASEVVDGSLQDVGDALGRAQDWVLTGAE